MPCKVVIQQHHQTRNNGRMAGFKRRRRSSSDQEFEEGSWASIQALQPKLPGCHNSIGQMKRARFPSVLSLSPTSFKVMESQNGFSLLSASGRFPFKTVRFNEEQNQYYCDKEENIRSKQERIDCWYSDEDYEDMQRNIVETVQTLFQQQRDSSKTITANVPGVCMFAQTVRSLLDILSQFSELYVVEDAAQVLVHAAAAGSSTDVVKAATLRQQLASLYTQMGTVEYVGLESYIVRELQMDCKARRYLLRGIVNNLQQEFLLQQQQQETQLLVYHQGPCHLQQEQFVKHWQQQKHIINQVIRDCCNEVSQAHCLQAQLLAVAQLYAV